MVVAAPLFLSCFSFISPEGAQAQVKSTIPIEPATNSEAQLYRQIGADIFCLATLKDYGLGYDKAISLASSIVARILYQRHGGFVASVGMEKLTDQQLYASSELQVLVRSMIICPDSVPEKQKEKVKEFLKKMSKQAP